MNSINDYIDEQEYHQVMMRDQWQERCQELETELLIARIRLSSAEISAKSWKEAYNKLETLLGKV